ncbi:MAG: SdpI family protein [Ruminococcus sp.]|nr:SdpI family protein [Ruminococcus sp.]
MEIWWLMLFMVMIVPVLMIVSGLMMKKKFSIDTQMKYGCRTELSRQNADTWRFANVYCGKHCFIDGIILLVICLTAHIVAKNRPVTTLLISDIIMILGQTMFFIGAVLWTDDALKKRFYDDGSPRNKED